MRVWKTGIVLAVLLIFTGLVAYAFNPVVNMNVTNAEVRDVLTALARVGRVSIMADDSVTGKITIQLNNVPMQTALELVTRTKGLVYQKVDNVIVVSTPERMGKVFGTVQVIRLNYAKAADVVNTLALAFRDLADKDSGSVAQTAGQSGKTSGQVQTGLDRLKVDEASNSIIFLGSPAESKRIRTLLAELDIPYEQVSLEAQVVAIDKTAGKNLGIDWKWSGLPAKTERSTEDGTETVTREYPGVIKFGKAYDGTPYEFTFQATLSALITKGDAKILAKPKITTINGKQARILIGDRIPVLMEKVEDGKTTTTIEYVEAGIKLVYVPRINGDGQITATVHTEVSTPTLVSEMKAYRITTREAETTVRMKAGETMVIGGLIGSEESGGTNKVPFLGDLPVLGKLFKSVYRNNKETEVVIFLTAHIVK